MTSRNRLAVLAAAAGTITGATCASGQVLQLVVKNTDTVPGIAGAAWAASSMFQNPSIDMFGNVGFRGTLLTGTGGVLATNNTTMWFGAPSSLSLVARTGFAAPGLSDGTTVTGFQSQTLPMSPNGNLWFGTATSVTAPFGNGYLATGPAGSLTSVARRGQILPGVATALSSNPGQAGSNPNVNNAGQTTFYSDAGVVGGVWVGNSANLQLAYSTGGTYAGLPAGTTVRSPFGGFIINGAGTLLSDTQLTTGVGGVTDANNEVLHTLPFGGSTFTQIAREGDVAPGSGGATYIRGLLPGGPNPLEPVTLNFGPGNFNNAGHAIYSAGLEGTGVVAGSNDAAMYSYDGTSASLFRRRGDATTAVSGATLALTGQQALSARLNNSGQIAYTTSLTQGVAGVTAVDDSVLLRTAIGSGSDNLVARESGSVPVLPGALWGTSFFNLLQNNAGQLVFASTLLDDTTTSTNDISTANDLALFAWDPTAGYMMIAREGDNLSSIGINMTLTGNWLSMFTAANNEGGANALSDNGWLTLRVSGTPLAGFTDNTAIVRTMIPAPGSALGLLIGGFAMLRRRNRR